MQGISEERIIATIVIANFNYGRFLPAAIESVLRQCGAPARDDAGRKILPIHGCDGFVELVICDAGSKDDSLDIITRYEDNLAWWCSEPDGGQSAAFNKGFRHGRGKFVSWLNADEEYLPGTFACLAKKIASHPDSKWITGNMLTFDETTRRISYVTWGPHWQPWFLTRNRACLDVFGPTSFVRRDVYEAIGPINENFHYSMDLEYWARLTMAGIRQTRLNHVCWAFGVHEASKSQGSMTPEQIAKGHAENVAREEVVGYKYKISFHNPWYVLWLVMRLFDGSLFIRFIMHRRLIGRKFSGCLEQEGKEDVIPLLYRDRRMEGETLLRKCQLVELHLLHVLDRVCRKHNIRYFLTYGSLLGAMRHNGFIPWDDDLDVGMTRKDFKKFLSVARSELPADVSLQSPEDLLCSGYRFAKLRDAYSFFFEPHKRIPTASSNGIYIDIFPYENAPRIPEWLRKKIGWLTSAFYEHKLDNFASIPNTGILRGFICYIKGVFCAFMHRAIRLVWGFLQLVVPSENLCGLLEFCERNMIFPKSWVVVMPRRKFEDGEFPVPNHPEEFLTRLYGNWRFPLPESKRQPHVTFADPVHPAKHKCMMNYEEQTGGNSK